eukprot:g10847.t1
MHQVLTAYAWHELTEWAFGEVELRNTEVMDAVFVYLAIHELGKLHYFRQDLGPAPVGSSDLTTRTTATASTSSTNKASNADPSTVLTHVMKTNAAVLPSFARLPRRWQIVLEGLVQMRFRFNQFLQNECLPASLDQLRIFLQTAAIHVLPVDAYQFYLFVSFADLGHVMSETTFRNFKEGRRALQYFLSSPTALAKASQAVGGQGGAERLAAGGGVKTQTTVSFDDEDLQSGGGMKIQEEEEGAQISMQKTDTMQQADSYRPLLAHHAAVGALAAVDEEGASASPSASKSAAGFGTTNTDNAGTTSSATGEMLPVVDDLPPAATLQRSGSGGDDVEDPSSTSYDIASCLITAYDVFLHSRGALCLPELSSAKERAVIRLCCNARVFDFEGGKKVQQAFSELFLDEQQRFIKYLNADGIHERPGFLLYHLPNFFQITAGGEQVQGEGTAQVVAGSSCAVADGRKEELQAGPNARASSGGRPPSPHGSGRDTPHGHAPRLVGAGAALTTTSSSPLLRPHYIGYERALRLILEIYDAVNAAYSDSLESIVYVHLTDIVRWAMQCTDPLLFEATQFCLEKATTATNAKGVQSVCEDVDFSAACDFVDHGGAANDANEAGNSILRATSTATSQVGHRCEQESTQIIRKIANTRWNPARRALSKSLNAYLKKIQNLNGLHVTTSCYELWKRQGFTNGGAKVIPAFSYASRYCVFFFDDNLEFSNVGPSGGQPGILNLRDLSGRFVDFTLGKNGFEIFDANREPGETTTVAAATANSNGTRGSSSTGASNDQRVSSSGTAADQHQDQGNQDSSTGDRDQHSSHILSSSPILYSREYNVVLCKVCILDAMLDDEFFTKIIEQFSRPMEKSLIFMDVNSTIVFGDLMSGKDPDFVLLSTLFEAICLVPAEDFSFDVGLLVDAVKTRSTSSEPPHDTTTATPKYHAACRKNEKISVKKLIKKFLSRDGYRHFWTPVNCRRLLEYCLTKGSVRIYGKIMQQLSDFELLYQEYTFLLKRTKKGIVRSWFELYRKYGKKNLIMINTFGVDSRKVIHETVQSEADVQMYSVNYDLWSARDKEKFKRSVESTTGLIRVRGKKSEGVVRDFEQYTAEVKNLMVTSAGGGGGVERTTTSVVGKQRSAAMGSREKSTSEQSSRQQQEKDAATSAEGRSVFEAKNTLLQEEDGGSPSASQRSLKAATAAAKKLGRSRTPPSAPAQSSDFVTFSTTKETMPGAGQCEGKQATSSVGFKNSRRIKVCIDYSMLDIAPKLANYKHEFEVAFAVQISRGKPQAELPASAEPSVPGSDRPTGVVVFPLQHANERSGARYAANGAPPSHRSDEHYVHAHSLHTHHDIAQGIGVSSLSGMAGESGADSANKQASNSNIREVPGVEEAAAIVAKNSASAPLVGNTERVAGFVDRRIGGQSAAGPPWPPSSNSVSPSSSSVSSFAAVPVITSRKDEKTDVDDGLKEVREETAEARTAGKEKEEPQESTTPAAGANYKSDAVQLETPSTDAPAAAAGEAVAEETTGAPAEVTTAAAQEAPSSEKAERSETEKPGESETEKPGERETEQPAASETEKPVATETEKPKPAASETANAATTEAAPEAETASTAAAAAPAEDASTGAPASSSLVTTGSPASDPLRPRFTAPPAAAIAAEAAKTGDHMPEPVGSSAVPSGVDPTAVSRKDDPEPSMSSEAPSKSASVGGTVETATGTASEAPVAGEPSTAGPTSETPAGSSTEAPAAGASSHKCKEWTPEWCSNPDPSYSEADIAAVHAHCKKKCKLCKLQAECKDDDAFKDAKGYSCRQWSPADCRATSLEGYTKADLRAVRRRCRQSCELCGESGTATTTARPSDSGKSFDAYGALKTSESESGNSDSNTSGSSTANTGGENKDKEKQPLQQHGVKIGIEQRFWAATYMYHSKFSLR